MAWSGYSRDLLVVSVFEVGGCLLDRSRCQPDTGPLTETRPPAMNNVTGVAHMRIIAHEQHFIDADLAEASGPAMTRLGPRFAAAYASGQGFSVSPARATLADLGESRLAAMDAGGISMQVLSCPWAQQAPADVAADLVSRATDKPAAAIRAGSRRSRPCRPLCPSPPPVSGCGAAGACCRSPRTRAGRSSGGAGSRSRSGPAARGG